MNKRRKGVLILNNWFDLMIDVLSPEQTIELLKLIKAKSNGIDYETYDVEVKTHWFHIQHSVDASIEKYAELCEKRREYGKLGGAPKGNSNARKNNQNNQKQPKQPMEKDKDKNTYPSDKSDSTTSLCDVVSSQQQELNLESLFNL